MKQIDILIDLINRSNVDEAIERIDTLLQSHSPEISKDKLFYLKGNAYRKQGNWKKALDNYQYAIDLNPTSPALQARSMVIDILNFYHKDMYNQ